LLQSVFNDLPLSVDWTGVYHEEGGDLVVTLSSPTPGLFKNALEASFDLLPHEWGITRNAARPTIDSYADHRTLTLRIPRDSRALKEVETFDALLRYEMPDGTINGITVTLSPNPAASTTVPQPVETQAQISFGTAILFALLGGLILNLMPCVFPILSMKALSLVQLQDKDRSAARISGLAYTAGILVSFTALAGVILTLKGGGESLGWGFHLQNPVITLILAYLLFIIGLNLAGLFELGGRLAGVGASLTQKKGLSGSFFTGVLATIVATPCTAPFMAGALGFALVQPAPMALAVFSALGLGLALPYLAISCIPALTRLMPRPGSWMVRFKEFLSFPMFASAAWLVWVLAQQAGVNAVMWALSGMVALAFGLWMARYKPARLVPRFMAGLAAAIVFLFAAMPVIDPHILRTQNTDSAMVAPQDFSSELYQTLLDGDDPVFVYMTAAWCITCKVNERVAIDIPETHKIFKDKNIAVLRGDWTTMRADITLFLKNHGRNGVPLYVYHGPRDGATGKRPDPVILPQILTPAILRDTF
jgi:thiol:disulfide interchange protein DsbD